MQDDGHDDFDHHDHDHNCSDDDNSTDDCFFNGDDDDVHDHDLHQQADMDHTDAPGSGSSGCTIALFMILAVAVLVGTQCRSTGQEVGFEISGLPCVIAVVAIFVLIGRAIYKSGKRSAESQ